MVHHEYAHGQEPNKILKEILRENDIGKSIKRMTSAHQAEVESLKHLLHRKEMHDILQQKINETITPGDRIRGYNEAIARMESDGMSMKDIHHALIKPLSRRKKVLATGSISGTITVEGANFINATVLAYDEYGFTANWANTDGLTGTYTIQDLLPGNYFVMTRSQYIDEFYDDIPAENTFENWRQVLDEGYLVQVVSGTDTPNIDFQLQVGAVITGMVYEADGTTPIHLVQNRPDFSLTTVDSETRLSIPSSSWSSTGLYSIRIPHIGNLKLSVSIPGYLEEYYDNKTDWSSADTITVNSVEDTVRGIDFSLEKGTTPTEPGPGAISGIIKGPAGLPAVAFGFVVAFNAADTTIAGFTWGARLDSGGYIITDLDPGEYFLYADDTRGNLDSSSNLVGEYYNDAPTPDLATTVTVVADDTTENVDFELAMAGGIEGDIENDAGIPVDSAFVFAVNADLLNLENGIAFPQPLFSLLQYLWFDIGITDSDGHYILDGLPTGNYIVRTLTIRGPHANTVFDEFYIDVQSILDFDEATVVSVTSPLVTTEIDFTLDRGGSITGMVYWDDGVTPVENAAVFAIVDSTGFPAGAPMDTTDETGVYTVSPLRTGEYNLMVLPLDGNVAPFPLAEFYDGVQDLDSAISVAVMAPDPTTGIDFTLDPGGFIHGIINLSDNFRAGTDTTWGGPVIAYNANTGNVAGVSDGTFAGGYRIGQLAPGHYKIAALPAVHGFGVTYYGGGETYDDAASAIVVVNARDSARADITLTPGLGTISGTVRMRDTNLPIVSVVLALDSTGHAVSFSMSGRDRTTGERFASPGDYILYGIRPGSWFVRTFAFFGIFNRLENPGTATTNGALAKSTCCRCPCGPIPGELFYEDIFYPPCGDIDGYGNKAIKYTWGATKNGKYSGKSKNSMTTVPKYRYPFDGKIPNGASAVSNFIDKRTSYHSHHGVTGIDFYLPDLRTIFSDVSDQNTTQPTDFTLEQNYPNPFNPETTIRYSLPQETKVELTIFNVLGQKITTLLSKVQVAGSHRIQWNGLDAHGRSMPSGVYIYRIKAGQFIDSRRLVLLR